MEHWITCAIISAKLANSSVRIKDINIKILLKRLMYVTENGTTMKTAETNVTNCHITSNWGHESV